MKCIDQDEMSMVAGGTNWFACAAFVGGVIATAGSEGLAAIGTGIGTLAAGGECVASMDTGGTPTYTDALGNVAY
jgi:hypothetical protein